METMPPPLTLLAIQVIQPPAQPAPVVQSTQPAVQSAKPAMQKPLVLPASQPAASVVVPTCISWDGCSHCLRNLWRGFELSNLSKWGSCWVAGVAGGRSPNSIAVATPPTREGSPNTNRKRKPPGMKTFTWLQGYVSLIGALATMHPEKVAELMAYQITIVWCYRDFEGVAWA